MIFETAAVAGGGGGDTKISSRTIPSVVIIRQDNGLNINQELVRTGFAKVINGKRKNALKSSDTTPSAASVVPSTDDGSSSLIDYDLLLRLEEQAKSQGFGIFQRCDATDNNVDVAYIDDTATTRIVNVKDKSLSKDPSSTITQPDSGWSTAPFQAEFEPLQRTMETVWGDDKQRI